MFDRIRLDRIRLGRVRVGGLEFVFAVVSWQHLSRDGNAKRRGLATQSSQATRSPCSLRPIYFFPSRNCVERWRRLLLDSEIGLTLFCFRFGFPGGHRKMVLLGSAVLPLCQSKEGRVRLAIAAGFCVAGFGGWLSRLPWVAEGALLGEGRLSGGALN